MSEQDYEQLHYRMQGKRDLPVVLFLHGFMGSSQDFEPVIDQLSDQFCCLAVDLPGHGKSIVEIDEHYTMSGAANLIIDLLNHLEISLCFLVGYSMGGRLGLYLTLRFPQRFIKTIIESSSPGLKTDRERQARIQQDDALAEQLEANFTSFLSNWYRQPLFHTLRQHPNAEQLLKQRSHNQPRYLAKSLRTLSTGRQPSLWSLLKQHSQPLLLLVGEADPKFQAINREMAICCQSAQLEVISECGHAIHLERPDAFTYRLQAFLQ